MNVNFGSDPYKNQYLFQGPNALDKLVQLVQDQSNGTNPSTSLSDIFGSDQATGFSSDPFSSFQPDISLDFSPDGKSAMLNNPSMLNGKEFQIKYDPANLAQGPSLTFPDGEATNLKNIQTPDGGSFDLTNEDGINDFLRYAMDQGASGIKKNDQPFTPPYAPSTQDTSSYGNFGDLISDAMNALNNALQNYDPNNQYNNNQQYPPFPPQNWQDPNNQYNPYNQNPYGQYGQNPYSSDPYSQYGQNPYGYNDPYSQYNQNPYNQNPYGQYGQNPYSNDPYSQYNQNPYAQNPYAYNNPYNQYTQNPYAQNPYTSMGYPMTGMIDPCTGIPIGQVMPQAIPQGLTYQPIQQQIMPQQQLIAMPVQQQPVIQQQTVPLTTTTQPVVQQQTIPVTTQQVTSVPVQTTTTTTQQTIPLQVADAQQEQGSHIVNQNINTLKNKNH